MATVSVDIDMDEFSTWELLSALADRLKMLSKKDAETLNDMVAKVNDCKPKRVQYSIIDQQKIDFFFGNLDKITLEKLEQITQ